MSDRILRRCLNCTIVSMIAGVGAAAVMLGYGGFLKLLAGQGRSATVELVTALVLGAATSLLIRNRNDLVGC